jgi:hypothetical protein
MDRARKVVLAASFLRTVLGRVFSVRGLSGPIQFCMVYGSIRLLRIRSCVRALVARSTVDFLLPALGGKLWIGWEAMVGGGEGSSGGGVRVVVGAPLPRGGGDLVRAVEAAA